MTERPIIFSGPMVKAILDGRKTQTRRVVKHQPAIANGSRGTWYDASSDLWRNQEQFIRDCCPYGKPGGRLWVREKWSHTGEGVWSVGNARSAMNGIPIYAATDKEPCVGCWFPSIHMPRSFSRINLEITEVLLERLHHITESDAKAEGFPIPAQVDNAGGMSAGRHFEYYWDDINGKKHPWKSNPWVWVIGFKRL